MVEFTGSGPGRRGLLVIGIVTLIAAILFAVSVLVPDDRPTAGPSASSTDQPTTALPTPPALQAVSFRGIEVLVPAGWTLYAEWCGTPVQDTVLIGGDDGNTLLCALLQPPGITIVRLASLSSPFGDELVHLATDPVTVSGLTARRGVGMVGRAEFAVLVVPDRGAVVSVESPDAASAQRLLDSVRVVAIDSRGCVDQVATLVSPGAPARPGAASLLVPGVPSGASICQYDENWLSGSAALDRAELDQLVAILNGLPEGTSPPQTLGPENCAAELERGHVVKFAYATGEPVDVYVHTDGCTALSANGARTTEISDALVSSLLAPGFEARSARTSTSGCGSLVEVRGREAPESRNQPVQARGGLASRLAALAPQPAGAGRWCEVRVARSARASKPTSPRARGGLVSRLAPLAPQPTLG